MEKPSKLSLSVCFSSGRVSENSTAARNRLNISTYIGFSGLRTFALSRSFFLALFVTLLALVSFGINIVRDMVTILVYDF